MYIWFVVAAIALAFAFLVHLEIGSPAVTQMGVPKAEHVAAVKKRLHVLGSLPSSPAPTDRLK